MRFDLDKILIDEIIFYMENQDGDFLLDCKEGIVIDLLNEPIDDEDEDGNNNYNDNSEGDEERFISLPEWTSADGYRLMEKFAAGLRNPVVRNELSAALNRNKGVFRAFRNVLEQYPETEKMWYNYKDREMKNEVINWYNSLREEWGLEPIGIEPEDNSSLVLEDFVIKEKDDFFFTAENANGELTGTVKAVFDEKKSVLNIETLEVKDEYRCMGIGKMLLARLIEKADEKKINVSIDVPFEFDYFSRSLLLEGFKPCMQRFIRKFP